MSAGVYALTPSTALPSAAQRGMRAHILRAVDLVAADLAVPVEAILSATRRADIVLARHLAMALAQDVCGASTVQIGWAMGRDHSTVFHALRRVAQLRATDLASDARYQRLASRMRSA